MIQYFAGARPVDCLPFGGGSESFGSSKAGHVRFFVGPGTTKSGDGFLGDFEEVSGVDWNHVFIKVALVIILLRSRSSKRW